MFKFLLFTICVITLVMHSLNAENLDQPASPILALGIGGDLQLPVLHTSISEALVYRYYTNPNLGYTGSPQPWNYGWGVRVPLDMRVMEPLPFLHLRAGLTPGFYRGSHDLSSEEPTGRKLTVLWEYGMWNLSAPLSVWVRVPLQVLNQVSPWIYAGMGPQVGYVYENKLTNNTDWTKSYPTVVENGPKGITWGVEAHLGTSIQAFRNIRFNTEVVAKWGWNLAPPRLDPDVKTTMGVSLSAQWTVD